MILQRHATFGANRTRLCAVALAWPGAYNPQAIRIDTVTNGTLVRLLSACTRDFVAVCADDGD